MWISWWVARTDASRLSAHGVDKEELQAHRVIISKASPQLAALMLQSAKQHAE